MAKQGRGQRGIVKKFARYKSWSIVWRDENGKRHWKSGYKGKSDAQNALNKILEKVRKSRKLSGDDAAMEQRLFRDYADNWMMGMKETLKPKAWASYGSMLKLRVLPFFGEKLVGDIGCGDTQEWFARLKADRAIKQKTVNNHLLLLSQIFEHALEADLIEANPCRKLKKLKVTDAEERIIPTPEEVVKVFQHLPKGYQSFLAVASVTGFRRAELLGLVWSDVNFERGTLRVRRSLQRIKRSDLDADSFRNIERIGNTCLAWLMPKTKKSIRMVGVGDQVMAILRSEYQRAAGAIAPSEAWLDNTPVFTSEPGVPLDPDSLYDTLRRAQEAAGAKFVGLHGLRHLYSSLLIESGVPFKTVQHNLGHANSQTTLDIYSRQLNPQDAASIDAISAKFPYGSIGGVVVVENSAQPSLPR